MNRKKPLEHISAMIVLTWTSLGDAVLYLLGSSLLLILRGSESEVRC